MLSKMIFRIFCRSDLLDFIDGGAGVLWGGEGRDKNSVLDTFAL